MAEKLQGVKYDQNKIRTDLLSAVALEEVAKVLTFGATKYGPNNWRYGMHWSRLIGAALRHIYAFMRCENLDEETKLSHIAHAMCCLMFLLEFQIKRRGFDDRWHEDNEVSEPSCMFGSGTETRKEKIEKIVKRMKDLPPNPFTGET